MQLLAVPAFVDHRPSYKMVFDAFAALACNLRLAALKVDNWIAIFSDPQ